MIYAFIAGLALLLMIIGIGNIYDKKKLPFLKKVLKVGIVILIVLLVIFLIATGRISAIAAALGALAIWAARLLQLGILYRNFKHGAGPRQANNTASDNMSTKEAYDILGLKPGATEKEINQAYRDLMAKLHPDHGGNDYLATRLNQAKDILLKKK